MCLITSGSILFKHSVSVSANVFIAGSFKCFFNELFLMHLHHFSFSFPSFSSSRNLYWTDWNRDSPKIETSYMDGTNRRILVQDDLGLPNGLTFDAYSSQLCWVDAGDAEPQA